MAATLGDLRVVVMMTDVLVGPLPEVPAIGREPMG
jgi:hypothetical protein